VARRSASKLANVAARSVLASFSGFRREFLATTRRAAHCFEHRDWRTLRADSSHRLRLYSWHVDLALERLRAELGDRSSDRVVWVGAKAVYSSLLDDRADWDLAETFFNSVARRLLNTVGVDPHVEFVDTDFDEPPAAGDSAHRTERFNGDLADLIERIAGVAPAVPWMDRAGDAAHAAVRVQAALDARGAAVLSVGAQVVRHPFFRGKLACVVARLATTAGPLPVVLAVRNGPRGLFVDAVLCEEADVSILFSFTRSYFHVATERPWDLVAFLQTLLPRKRRAELYISLGHVRQGKTELFRDLKARLEQGGRFERAPGTPGLVMACFTLDDYDLVFKVIRDHFPAEKETTAAAIAERYRWVHLHDRAGRLVDAQEFEDLRLPRDQFATPMLVELLEGCGRTVWSDGDAIVLRQCWVERRLEPLNLAVRRRDEEGQLAVLAGYADALRDLAACGIFPGDLLLKNFGVTRHGRVAFYDYDELVALDECNFRDLPEPQTLEQEMAAEPWYSVAPGDVFPEEFPRFLGLRGPVRRRFVEAHGELFTATWWRSMQERLAGGRVLEFPPYGEELRLPDAAER